MYLLKNSLHLHKFIFLKRPPITRVSDKVLIPQEEYPDINFVGLLIGPRGNTLKGKKNLFRTPKSAYNYMV